MKFCKRWQTAAWLGFALLLLGCDSSRPKPVPVISASDQTANPASTTPSSLGGDALAADSPSTADPQSVTPPQSDTASAAAAARSRRDRLVAASLHDIAAHNLFVARGTDRALASDR
ncbi:MAG: hypothetical protein R3C56_08400 [Pirellulaceae bacterium]